VPELELELVPALVLAFVLPVKARERERAQARWWAAVHAPTAEEQARQQRHSAQEHLGRGLELVAPVGIQRGVQLAQGPQRALLN
jgi:hypothetical protein